MPHGNCSQQINPLAPMMPTESYGRILFVQKINKSSRSTDHELRTPWPSPGSGASLGRDPGLRSSRLRPGRSRGCRGAFLRWYHGRSGEANRFTLKFQSKPVGLLVHPCPLWRSRDFPSLQLSDASAVHGPISNGEGPSIVH